MKLLLSPLFEVHSVHLLLFRLLSSLEICHEKLSGGAVLLGSAKTHPLWAVFKSSLHGCSLLQGVYLN